MDIACAYVAAIVYFVFLVDYPGATEPEDKVSLIIEHHTSMYVMHLICFEFVAVALIVVTLAVYQHLRADAPETVQVASVFGVVRAGLLLGSVLVFNHGMAIVVDQQTRDTHQAVATWQGIETVADALGGTGGDILLGLWLIPVSWVALRAEVFPRALNWLGLGVGTAAVVSIVPGLGVLEVVVGLLQIVWFLWFGTVTALGRASGAPARTRTYPRPSAGP